MHTLAMPQSRVPLFWPWVSAHSVLVKIACRNKLCTQKGNPADLLNVLIRSHSSSVIIHQCGEDDRQKLHQFKRKRKKALSPLWFPIVPNQSCLLQWYVLPVFSVLLISLPVSCFQDTDNHYSECCLIYCCWPVLRDLRTGCLYLLLTFKVGASVNFFVVYKVFSDNLIAVCWS